MRDIQLNGEYLQYLVVIWCAVFLTLITALSAAAQLRPVEKVSDSRPSV